MKLVILDVPFPGQLQMPTQKLDPGEFIKVRIVELSKLRAELIGMRLSHRYCYDYDEWLFAAEYEKKVTSRVTDSEQTYSIPGFHRGL